MRRHLGRKIWQDRAHNAVIGERIVMYCVVGSGPSGVACATALLEKGAQVLMLDAGLTLEPDRAAAVEQLRRSSPDQWDPATVEVLTGEEKADTSGIPLKRCFGSDFPYRDIDKHIPCTFDGVGVRPSLAQGGFSNVWGAAIMPYTAADISDWPITSAELAPHYESAARLLPISARRDALEDRFPLYMNPDRALKLSNQAQRLMNNLDRNRQELARDGIYHGAARLAVRPAEDSHHVGCNYCGLCMHGCPYGCIYNSGMTLSALGRNPGFTYRPNTIVERIEENDNTVAIRAVDRLTGASQRFEVERVFLAAGVLPTTRLLLESRDMFNTPVAIQDSQYFLIPLLLFRGSNDVRRESLYSLSQLFLEIFDDSLSPHSIHLQVYSYNTLITGALRNTLSKVGMAFDPLVRSLECRLIVAQGYLHSSCSSRIQATLKKVGKSQNNTTMELRADINPNTRNTIKRLTRKLMRNCYRLGAVPLPPLVRIAQPGRGFHCGGTFPMRREPQNGQSDVLGRPYGWGRVHAVDSTVLPTVPATTITFSVMANAHRIASLAA